MISGKINFKNFYPIIKKNEIKKILKFTLNSNNEVINSLKKNFKLSYDIKKIKKIQNNSDLRVIGIGGSILGAKAIYSFLRHKI